MPTYLPPIAWPVLWNDEEYDTNESLRAAIADFCINELANGVDIHDANGNDIAYSLNVYVSGVVPRLLP